MQQHGFESHGQLDAIGIASFGPVELDRTSPRWGHITNTPKPGWANCDIAGFFGERFEVPIGFDTDVNGAALAEHQLGAGLDASSLAYITVGTGIGGGLIVGSKPVHGVCASGNGTHLAFVAMHSTSSSLGHALTHRDCLEGLASGPAIKARWGASLSELPSDHIAHEIIADYLAQLAHTLIALTAAEVIVMGGGVMKTPLLLDRINKRSSELGAAYFPGNTKHKIVAPSLGDQAGITGALLLSR